MFTRLLFAFAIFWSAAGIAFAAEPEHKAMEGAALFPSDGIKWVNGPPSLPKGAQVAVLEGDPNKEGPFVFRVKAPDGYRIPPHTSRTARADWTEANYFSGNMRSFAIVQRSAWKAESTTGAFCAT